MFSPFENKRARFFFFGTSVLWCTPGSVILNTNTQILKYSMSTDNKGSCQRIDQFLFTQTTVCGVMYNMP